MSNRRPTTFGNLPANVLHKIAGYGGPVQPAIRAKTGDPRELLKRINQKLPGAESVLYDVDAETLIDLDFILTKDDRTVHEMMRFVFNLLENYGTSAVHKLSTLIRDGVYIHIILDTLNYLDEETTSNLIYLLQKDRDTLYDVLNFIYNLYVDYYDSLIICEFKRLFYKL